MNVWNATVSAVASTVAFLDRAGRVADGSTANTSTPFIFDWVESNIGAGVGSDPQPTPKRYAKHGNAV